MNSAEDWCMDFIVGGIICLANAFFVWMIWPWVMVEVFHLPEITYSKAFWLCCLGAFLTWTRSCGRSKDRK